MTKEKKAQEDAYVLRRISEILETSDGYTLILAAGTDRNRKTTLAYFGQPEGVKLLAKGFRRHFKAAGEFETAKYFKEFPNEGL